MQTVPPHPQTHHVNLTHTDEDKGDSMEAERRTEADTKTEGDRHKTANNTTEIRKRATE